ncbi:hypothetical protein DY000_02023606, partial [Brassica cretica]
QIQMHREYKQRILSSYQRLHGEIYSLDPASVFVPSFLKAATPKSEENFKSIMVQAAPGFYTFEMLQPKFCEMLLEEVLHMEKWAHDSNFFIRRPSTLNIFGVALDDFGFESMLQKLLEDFIILFPEVCGSGLDSHHGYVVEYGEYIETDAELYFRGVRCANHMKSPGEEDIFHHDYSEFRTNQRSTHIILHFHVDDSEITLNVCLGKQFSGGELYFRGVRCANHMKSPGEEVIYNETNHQSNHCVIYYNSPFSDVVSTIRIFFTMIIKKIFRGSHRHGAKAITNGIRANLIMWCRRESLSH